VGMREWRGDCPACGYPSAAVLTEREGRLLLWCASCDDREGLVASLRGDGYCTTDLDRNAKCRLGRGTRRRGAFPMALWRDAVPCCNTAAAVYLARRGLLDTAASDVLRFYGSTSHPCGDMLPAMLAQVVDVSGKPVALHRTYLHRNGAGKADIEPSRASLGPVAGGAIRLDAAAEELAIGEGIESAASAGVLLGLPAWAAVSAGNLGRTLSLPPEVRSVVIAADADPPGRRAAEAASTRWQAEGRRVRIAVPHRPGADFNDVLLEVDHG
jgi:putative DNA primase/helicase